MNKKTNTLNSIMSQALNLSSKVGLEGLTIGSLAKRVGISKSGLYAHFESKEDLQVRVLDSSAERFIEVIVRPTIKMPRGIERVRTMFEKWLEWISGELSGGCPFIAAATEYDDRKGPVRDRLEEHLMNATETIKRAAKISIEEGHFRRNLNTDQFAFDFWAIMFSYHHYLRMLGNVKARSLADRAFEKLLANSVSI